MSNTHLLSLQFKAFHILKIFLVHFLEICGLRCGRVRQKSKKYFFSLSERFLSGAISTNEMILQQHHHHQQQQLHHQQQQQLHHQQQQQQEQVQLGQVDIIVFRRSRFRPSNILL